MGSSDLTHLQGCVLLNICSCTHVLTQELQAEVNAHRKHLNHILKKGRSLAKSNKSEREEVLQRCGWFFFVIKKKFHVHCSESILR